MTNENDIAGTIILDPFSWTIFSIHKPVRHVSVITQFLFISNFWSWYPGTLSFYSLRTQGGSRDVTSIYFWGCQRLCAAKMRSTISATARPRPSELPYKSKPCCCFCQFKMANFKDGEWLALKCHPWRARASLLPMGLSNLLEALMRK